MTQPLKPIVAAFFFWGAGSMVQKSARGLLQSLVHHILTQDEDACDELWKTSDLSIPYAWTIPDLSDLLATTCSFIKRPCLIFIDGLDEFEGQLQAFIDIVNKIRFKANVKLCISSRPLPTLANEFATAAKLKLQNLIVDSIHRYAESRTTKAVASCGGPPPAASDVAKLGQKASVKEVVSEIRHKADSVFL